MRDDRNERHAPLLSYLRVLFGSLRATHCIESLSPSMRYCTKKEHHTIYWLDIRTYWDSKLLELDSVFTSTIFPQSLHVHHDYSHKQKNVMDHTEYHKSKSSSVYLSVRFRVDLRKSVGNLVLEVGQ
jgi:hypothetical protein